MKYLSHALKIDPDKYVLKSEREKETNRMPVVDLYKIVGRDLKVHVQNEFIKTRTTRTLG